MKQKLVGAPRAPMDNPSNNSIYGFGETFKLKPQRSRAYCVECKKTVEISFELDTDETGEEFETPICSECGMSIRRCYDCKLWRPDSEETPLGRTYGVCMRLRLPPSKRVVHAMNFVCNYFLEVSE